MDKASWNEQWMGYPVGPHYSESSNIDNADRLKGRLLLIVGEMDNNVPPESTLRLVDALIKANKDFDMIFQPGGGHGGGGRHELTCEEKISFLTFSWELILLISHQRQLGVIVNFTERNLKDNSIRNIQDG